MATSMHPVHATCTPKLTKNCWRQSPLGPPTSFAISEMVSNHPQRRHPPCTPHAPWLDMAETTRPSPTMACKGCQRPVCGLRLFLSLMECPHLWRPHGGQQRCTAMHPTNTTIPTITACHIHLRPLALQPPQPQTRRITAPHPAMYLGQHHLGHQTTLQTNRPKQPLGLSNCLSMSILAPLPAQPCPRTSYSI